MRVLNITQHDWSNYSHENANALRSVGIWCEDIKENPHWAVYPSQSTIVSTRYELEERIAGADLVQIFHTDLRMWELCKKVGQNNVIIYHTGTKYRKDPSMYKELFRGVLGVVCDTPDLIGLNRKKEPLISMTVNTTLLTCNKPVKKPYIVAHYPSKSHVKGTKKVEKVVRSAHKELNDFVFKMSMERVNYYEQIQRVKECDIYIEMLSPKQDGYNYGAWGTSALEAAALGKVVITCDRYAGIYKKNYGANPPFLIAHTQPELRKVLLKLLMLKPSEIRILQDKHRDYILKYHSHLETGYRLKKLYKKLCPALLRT